MMRYNPYTSKAQHRLFRAMEARGELPRGTASRWYHETPHYASLPEYVSDYRTVRRRRKTQTALFAGFGQTKLAPTPCKWMTTGNLTRHPTTGEIFVAGSQGQCIPTGWSYATVQNGQCGNFQGISVCVSDKTKIPLMPTEADIAEGPQQPYPAGETWWQRYGGDIMVGTITAVTGGIALYLAMRYVERKRR